MLRTALQPSRIAVIANRTAGGGRAVEAIHQAKRSLWGWQVEFIFPASIDELRTICANMNPLLYKAAVVIGGDGTINQALRGLRQSGVPLFPFPGGTANDLAAELGLNGDWEQVQRLIDRDQQRPIDLIEVNGVPFATVAGVGIGSHLTEEFNRRRQTSAVFRQMARSMKTQSYMLLSAKTILLRNDYFHHLHIRSETFDEKIKTAALFICNQGRLGGNLRVSPQIENDDSRFNVLIVPRVRAHQLIRGLAELRLGKIPSDFILFSTHQISLKDQFGKSIRVFGDGEILTEYPELNFKLQPAGIRVFRETQRRSEVQTRHPIPEGVLAKIEESVS